MSKGKGPPDMREMGLTFPAEAPDSVAPGAWRELALAYVLKRFVTHDRERRTEVDERGKRRAT